MPRLSRRLGAVASLLGLLLAGTPAVAGGAVPAPLDCTGAGALAEGCPAQENGLVYPAPPLAEKDSIGNGKAEGCWTDDFFQRFESCTFGSADAQYTVALVGNSHAAQYLEPLREWADRADARLVTYLIPKCFATTERIEFRANPSLTERCHEWGQWAQRETNALQPDLIITSERTYMSPERKAPGGAAAVWKQGYAEYLKGWTEQRRRVLVIRDSPVPREPIPECVTRNPLQYTACAGDPQQWLPADPLVEAAREADPALVSVTDPSKYMCTDTQCPAVIGKILVYRDGSHLSATWIRALAPYLEQSFLAALNGPR